MFRLSDAQWEQTEPHLPGGLGGKERADDRRVISGIVDVLKSGCRWGDCPEAYGLPTTIYDRGVGWPRRGISEILLLALAGRGRAADTLLIDTAHIKTRRSAAGGKGKAKPGDWPLKRSAQHEDSCARRS